MHSLVQCAAPDAGRQMRVREIARNGVTQDDCGKTQSVADENPSGRDDSPSEPLILTRGRVRTLIGCRGSQSDFGPHRPEGRAAKTLETLLS